MRLQGFLKGKRGVGIFCKKPAWRADEKHKILPGFLK